MVKIELARIISAKMDTTLNLAETFVDIFLETIGESLENGEKVTLAGFGVFDVRHIPEHLGRNPRTGESLTIPSNRYPSFRAGKRLKDRVAIKTRINSNTPSKKETHPLKSKEASTG